MSRMFYAMQRARRRWKILTVLVAAPVTALVIAISLTARPATEPAAQAHLFPAEYYGPVWVRFPDDDSTLDVRIVWGEWTYRWSVRPGDARVYRFSKDKPRPGDPNVPVEVIVDPEVEVEFGYGTFPEGAQPLPAQWDSVDGSSVG